MAEAARNSGVALTLETGDPVQQVKLLGLAALDEQANPVYDMQMAQKLNERGMSVAALTPEHFAQWMAEVMQ